ncbi:hypothetical protein EJB05_07549, partial [Eragrostis curvula]
FRPRTQASNSVKNRTEIFRNKNWVHPLLRSSSSFSFEGRDSGASSGPHVPAHHRRPRGVIPVHRSERGQNPPPRPASTEGGFPECLDSKLGMYGQGGSFNPHYRHGAPPPGVTGPFPQQPPPPPPPPPQQQQAGVTGPFPQQPVPPPPAPYRQPPGMPLPPGAYPHTMPSHQNPAYPFAHHGQMHHMPMGQQQRGFAPMPMSGQPPQAMYQAPQYPMPGSLPPPPPRPPTPPPLPPSSPPPLPPAPPTPVVAQSWNAGVEGKESAPDVGHVAPIEKAETQLIVSDDSDMDMDGDEDSPSRKHLTPDNSSLVTAECTGDVNVPKSLSDVSSLGNDLPPGSTGDAKTTNVTVKGGSPFQLIQGYASNDSEDEVDAGAPSTLVILCKDNENTHMSDRNTERGHQKLANEKGNVNTSHVTEQNGEARKYHLKDESRSVKQDIDMPGHLVKDDLCGSDELDGVQRSKRHGRSERKRSRSKSPLCRSPSPLGANKVNPLQSSSPGTHNRSPLAKRVHPSVEGKDSGDRIDMQEGPAGTEKLDSSNKGDNTALDGALGQHGCDDNLTTESSRSMAASANASDAHKIQRPCPLSESQSDLNVSSSAGNETLASQSSAGISFPSVQAIKSSMTCDLPQPHPQSLYPSEHMSSNFAQAHPSSSNMIRPPGPPSLATSEFPQTQFEQNIVAPANEFLQNQMRTFPAPDVSHSRLLNFHDHTLQPVPDHQQAASVPLENAPVLHPDRWSNYSGGIGLPYSCHQPPYGQQQPPVSLDSGTNLGYPSFQRFPSNLPGSSDLGPVSDTGLPKSSIKPHYNPFASTFEQTDPSLGIDPTVSPNAVGSFSAKAVEHMNTSSPFGQSYPGSGSHASAEVVRNKQKQFRPEFTSGAPYDPLIDCIEPSSSSINKVDPGKEKCRSADASKLMNTEVDSNDMHGLGVVAESEVEGLGEVAADTEPGVVENASPEFLGAKDWSSDIPCDIDNDQSLDKSKKAKDSRSMKLFKNAIADFVKEVLKPSWRQGNMSKEAFKTIVKKTVDKVSNSVPSSHIPKTPAKIKQYVQSSQRKVTKLVMGYVDKYVKP